MTIYFVIPKNKITAFQAAYAAQNIRKTGDNPNEAEKAVMVNEASPGTRAITGTSRATQAVVDALALGNAPWLAITDVWPNDWIQEEDLG